MTNFVKDKIMACKSLYNIDLKQLFQDISNTISFINTSEPSTLLKDLNNTLQRVQFPDVKKGDAINHYFDELETLQNQLVSVKDHANEMGETNRNLNIELKGLKTELQNVKENLDRKEKKAEKLKTTINDYRKSTLKLISTVENELSRISNMNVDEIPDNLENLEKELQRQSSKIIESANQNFDSSFIGSPKKSVNQSTVNWFDVEKSQERYEALLNSYNKIIHDKDAHIKNIYDEVSKLKKDRAEIEDDSFNQIREKDKLITNAEYEKNNAINSYKIYKKENEDRIKRLQGEINYLENRLETLQNNSETTDPIRGIKQKLEESRDELNEEKKKWYDLKNSERRLQSQIYDLQLELETTNKKLEFMKKEATDDSTMSKKELEKKVACQEEENEFLIRAKMINQEKNKERERDFADIKLKLADKEQDLTTLKNELMLMKDNVFDVSKKLKLKNHEVEDLLDIEDKIRHELDRNKNQDIVLKSQRDKAIKEIEWLKYQLQDRDHKVTDLEKYVVKFEDKSLKLAKTVEKLRNQNNRSPSPNVSHRFVDKPTYPKNTINAFSPFPISSTKKISSPIRKNQAIYPMQSKSPLRKSKVGSSMNCSVDVSNMNKVFQMYKR